MVMDYEGFRYLGYFLMILLGVGGFAVLVMNLGFAWAAAQIARSRRRGYLRWFIGGIFFGPLAALLVAILPRGRSAPGTWGETRDPKGQNGLPDKTRNR
jgi:hypothetical protein